MRTRLFGLTLVLLLVAFGTVAMAALPSIEGTYKLTSRKLADGTTLGEKDLHGLYTLVDGHRNFNVGWMDPSGKHFSYSMISTYKLTDKEYTETVVFSVMNDEIGVMPGSKPGTGPVYAMGETKTVPVTVEGSKVSFRAPFDPPALVFDGNTITGTLEGVFVDTWEKVK
ncbi:hypothetical protein HZB60_00310 [candidate division KSB1 bacterium]|nr:hypothetical protein [candidate division KSB1 bacterium]